MQQSIQNIHEKENLAASPPTPPLFVASNKVPADVASLAYEQGASLMRNIVPHLVLGRSVTIDFSTTKQVTPAYMVGLLEHLSKDEWCRIRFAGLEGKYRAVAMSVAHETVAGARDFDQFFSLYEANGKQFPVLLKEPGIVTVLQGTSWAEWVDHDRYVKSDPKGYSETAVMLYEQDSARRAENSH